MANPISTMHSDLPADSDGTDRDSSQVPQETPEKDTAVAAAEKPNTSQGDVEPTSILALTSILIGLCLAVFLVSVYVAPPP